MFSSICACHKVQLSACTADMSCAGCFRANLAIQVHGYTAIDGYKMIQLSDGFRIIHISHRCRHNINIMIQEFIQICGTITDGEYTFAAVQQFFLICDFACLIQFQIAITHQFCMHTQVFQVGISNQTTQSVGHAADTNLQCDTVIQIRENIPCNLFVDFGRRTTRSNAQRFCAFYNIIYFGNMDMITFHTENKWHIRIYFQNNVISCVQHFLHAAVCQTIAEVPVFIHGRYCNHGNINGSIPS